MTLCLTNKDAANCVSKKVSEKLTINVDFIHFLIHSTFQTFLLLERKKTQLNMLIDIDYWLLRTKTACCYYGNVNQHLAIKYFYGQRRNRSKIAY